MKGRKPKPTELKRRSGNPGRRKLNKYEPSAGGILRKPGGLDTNRSELWAEAVDCFTKLGILDRADQIALELLCRTHYEWRECLEIFETDGRVCNAVDKNGRSYLTTHPAVRQASDGSKRLRSILSDFGMTPSARIHLGVDGNRKNSKLWTLIELAGQG